MNSYKCTKCDETASSKNPMTRNVFPGDMTAAIMTNIVNVMTEKKENSDRKVTFEFLYCDTDKSLSDDELEMVCANNIQTLTEDNIRHWLCNHRWLKVGGDRDENDFR